MFTLRGTHRRTLSLSILAALMASPASAADELFFSALPIVATVSRLPQRVADAPTAVTVISQEVIKASGARSLNDVFRLVPGFQTYVHNTEPARVTYHGITEEDFSPRVQVLVDGRSLHSPLFRGGVNWALIPVALDDIERIEVVRGSNTTSYGTNAFLGVINIITLDPALMRGSSVGASHGNQGVRDYTARTGATLGDGGNFRLSYQQLDDDGLENQHDWIDSFRSRLLDVRASYQLNIRDQFELHLGSIEGRLTNGRLDTAANRLDALGRPHVSDPRNPIRDFDQSSSWLQLRWLRALSADADFSLRYAYSADTASDAFVDPGMPAGLKRVDTVGDRGHRSEIEAVHNFVPFADTRLVWGASWREDTRRSKTMLHGKDKAVREVSRGFANAEWAPVSWFTGNLGLSSEYDSLAGNNLAFRGSASVHLTPENTVRVGYARAWRTASILDYRANQRRDANRARLTGTPDLPAERLDSWEVGYLGNWTKWNTSLDVRLFREQMKDRLFQIDPNIDDALGDQVYPIQNIRIKGIEYQWKWQPASYTRVIVSQSFVRIDSDYTSAAMAQQRSNLLQSPGRLTLVDEMAEQSAPRRSSSLLWMQQLPFGLEASVARYWVDAMKWTRNTSVGNYIRTDARLGYPFSVGSQRGEVAYTVQSLDGDHGELRSDGRPSDRVVGRRHWVSLQLAF